MDDDAVIHKALVEIGLPQQWHRQLPPLSARGIRGSGRDGALRRPGSGLAHLDGHLTRELPEVVLEHGLEPARLQVVGA